MSDYDDVVETSLMEEEQAVELSEREEGHAEPRSLTHFLPVYITVISLVVSIAAVVMAFAADQWMNDALAEVADSVDFFTLRVEKRCQDIQQDMAVLAGRPLDAKLNEEIERTAKDLAVLEANQAAVTRDANITDRAHYVLAIGIMFLQMATALAVVIGALKRHRLIYASAILASGGAMLTIIGIVKFVA